MFFLNVVAVGKLRPFFREAADEYLRRLRRYAEVQEREVREAGKAGNPRAQRREESARLAEALPASGITVALSRTGTSWSSAELARRLGRWREEATGVSFMIGGAEGLAPELGDRARYRWSLGPLTLPHELARVVVLEQLYRGFTILAGERYHKGGE